jgi:hypothetical protein
MLIPKGNRLYSITHLKCPRCNEGNLFKEPNAWKLKKVLEMPAKCEHCGLVFERETWFFYGAMYVSYGLNVALGVGLFLIYYFFFFEFAIHWFLISLTLLILIFFPWITRLSRAIWINFFEHYQQTDQYLSEKK